MLPLDGGAAGLGGGGRDGGAGGAGASSSIRARMGVLMVSTVTPSSCDSSEYGVAVFRVSASTTDDASWSEETRMMTSTRNVGVVEELKARLCRAAEPSRRGIFSSTSDSPMPCSIVAIERESASASMSSEPSEGDTPSEKLTCRT